MKSFDRSLPMMLHRALDAVMPPFRQIFSEYGLTEQQWRIMRVLWEVESRPLVSLAESTLIPAPSLVGVVDRLCRTGLVERARSQTDRRVVYVRCTAKGKALEAEVTPKVDAIYKALEDSIDPALWRSLFFAMDQLIAVQSRKRIEEKAAAGM